MIVRPHHVGAVRASAAGLAIVVVVAASLLMAPTPAAAHGTAGQAPVNFTSRVVAVTPATAGVSVRITDLGEHVEVRSSGPVVVVLGYEGEPYLRIDTEGVWRNERSPAVALNRTSKPTESAPPEYDAGAEPRWVHTGSETLVRWHDHRIHPMSSRTSDYEWSLDLLVDGSPVTVTGEVVFVDAPGLVWALVLMAGTGVSVLIGARRSSRATLGIFAVACVAAVIALTGARWSASTEVVAARLGAAAAPGLGAALLVVAAARLARRGLGSAAPLLVFGFGATFITVGLALTPWLTHAVLPASGPAAVWRSLIAAVMGASAVALVVGARALRQR